MKILIPIIVIALASTSCKRSSSTDTDRRIKELETKLAAAKTPALPATAPTLVPAQPSEADMLAVACMFAERTQVAVPHSPGPETAEPSMKVEKVSIKASSPEGAFCLVVFDATVSYLPAFYKSRGVVSRYPDNSYFKDWLGTIGETNLNFSGLQIAYTWDPQWHLKQAGFQEITFTDIKIRMRRWDAGWQFDQRVE